MIGTVARTGVAVGGIGCWDRMRHGGSSTVLGCDCFANDDYSRLADFEEQFLIGGKDFSYVALVDFPVESLEGRFRFKCHIGNAVVVDVLGVTPQQQRWVVWVCRATKPPAGYASDVATSKLDGPLGGAAQLLGKRQVDVFVVVLELLGRRAWPARHKEKDGVRHLGAAESEGDREREREIQMLWKRRRADDGRQQTTRRMRNHGSSLRGASRRGALMVRPHGEREVERGGTQTLAAAAARAESVHGR
jgi:hypothetical protein